MKKSVRIFAFNFLPECVEEEVWNRISSSALVMFMHDKHEDLYKRMRLDTNKQITQTSPNTSNFQHRRSDASLKYDSLNSEASMNNIDSLKEKLLEYIMLGDTENASNFYQKHKKPKMYSNESKIYIDTNAKNIIGPIAIKAAMEKDHWNMVDWLLEIGFECEGVGKIVSSWNGIVYVGAMKNGKPNGKGRRTWSDGAVYEGSWKDGKCNGQGKCSYASGSVYKGSYKDGKAHGHGKRTYASGLVYEGNWEDDQRNGQGRSTWPDGAVYEGFYKNDKRNGHGTYRWPNGAVYVGCWKNGICFK